LNRTWSIRMRQRACLTVKILFGLVYHTSTGRRLLQLVLEPKLNPVSRVTEALDGLTVDVCHIGVFTVCYATVFSFPFARRRFPFIGLSLPWSPRPSTVNPRWDPRHGLSCHQRLFASRRGRSYSGQDHGGTGCEAFFDAAQ
jgi:hypothetical protein